MWTINSMLKWSCLCSKSFSLAVSLQDFLLGKQSLKSGFRSCKINFSKRDGLLDRNFFKIKWSVSTIKKFKPYRTNQLLRQETVLKTKRQKNLRYWTGHGGIRDKHEVSITHDYFSLRIQSLLIFSSFSAIIKITLTFPFTSYECHAALRRVLFTMVYLYPLSRLIYLNSHNRLPSDVVAQLVRPRFLILCYLIPF